MLGTYNHNTVEPVSSRCPYCNDKLTPANDRFRYNCGTRWEWTLDAPKRTRGWHINRRCAELHVHLSRHQERT